MAAKAAKALADAMATGQASTDEVLTEGARLA